MACRSELWDFECPQFVDFEAGLQNDRDDIFFDCKDHQTPGDGNICKTPDDSNTKGYLTDDDEDKLLDKVSAALSILENTPKVKKSALKGKVVPEKFRKNLWSHVTKSAFKCKTVPAPRTVRRRSRSIDHLNKIVTENTGKGNLRRSSSLNDVVTLKWKYPVTPMCLKRTIIKAKGKVIKTTEEMELEEIAKLQKVLKDHLRYNEMNFKKMRLKPRPCVTSKTQAKPENLKETKNLTTLKKKSTLPERETRRNIHALPHVAIKNEAKKLENIINNRPVSCKKVVKEVDFKKSNNSVSSAAASFAEPLKSSIQRTKKPAGSKILDHSGLVFRPSIRSNSSFKFRFDSVKIKTNETKDELTGAKLKEMCHTKSFNMYDGKENIRQQSSIKETKPKPLQNAIYDLLSQSNEIIEKRKGNPLKDVPLSENIARN